MLAGVIVDAAGGTRTEVARAGGVSPSAVKQWRQMPAYKAELAKLKDSHLQASNDLVKTLHDKIFKGAIDAVDVIRDNMTATNDKGTPQFRTRQEAAELMITKGTELIKLLQAGSGGGKGGGGGGGKDAPPPPGSTLTLRIEGLNDKAVDADVVEDEPSR